MKRRMLVGGVECWVECGEGQEEEFRRKLSTPFTVFDDYSSPPRPSSGKDRKTDALDLPPSTKKFLDEHCGF